MSQTWAKCLDFLKGSLPLGEYSVWVKPLQASERNETLYLNAPSASALKYIHNHKSLEAAIVKLRLPSLSVTLYCSGLYTGPTNTSGK